MKRKKPWWLYRPLYGEGGLWVRPAAMWNEILEKDGKIVRRFEYLTDKKVATEPELDTVALLQDLKTLLQIKTVNGDAGEITDEAPLGTGINEALNFVLLRGQSMRTKLRWLLWLCRIWPRVELGRDHPHRYGGGRRRLDRPPF